MSESSQVGMAQAQGTYRIFIKLAILGSIGIVVLLILMAFFLL